MTMPYDVLPNTDPPPEHARLRRYMSIAKLVSMLATSSMYCAPLLDFEDPLEGTVPVSFGADGKALEIIELMRRQTRASCWHEEEVESDALWRLYGTKEEIVALGATVGRLRAAIDGLPERISISRVRYIDFASWVLPPGEVFYPAIYKRHAFAHEREVRIVVQPALGWEALLAEGVPGRLPGLSIPVDVGTLIDEVWVSPYGGQWLLQAVRALVGSLGLSCAVEFSPLRVTA